MVIGTGLLGKTFSSYKTKDDVLIFASGVSNSKTEDSLAFQREQNLIQSQFGFKGTFVYFGTCSMLDKSLRQSKYILHKEKMEQLIKDHFENYLIVRLPNLIGKTTNPKTIVNFFYQAILNNQTLEIQSNSYRYFVKDTDVFYFIDALLSENKKLNLTANLIVSSRISVLEVVQIFEDLFKKRAQIEMNDQQSDYTVELDPIFEKYLQEESVADGYSYVKDAIYKTYFV